MSFDTPVRKITINNSVKVLFVYSKNTIVKKLYLLAKNRYC